MGAAVVHPYYHTVATTTITATTTILVQHKE